MTIDELNEYVVSKLPFIEWYDNEAEYFNLTEYTLIKLGYVLVSIAPNICLRKHNGYNKVVVCKKDNTTEDGFISSFNQYLKFNYKTGIEDDQIKAQIDFLARRIKEIQNELKLLEIENEFREYY